MKFGKRSIQLIAGQHGNERGPVRALQSAGVSFILGNPKAYLENKRFTEHDLNASYGDMNDNYESVRARELLQQIPIENVVVDFHTTSAPGPSFVILTNADMLPLAEMTGLKYVVLMTHNIKNGKALINARDGIAIEMSGYDSEESFKCTLSVVEHLELGVRQGVTLFEVFDQINAPGQYENFVKCHDGTYPILVGEDSYDFIGLRARLVSGGTGE
jgi:hypothetical protein